MAGIPAPGRLLILCVILVSFAAGFLKISGRQFAGGFRADSPAAATGTEPRFQSRFASSTHNTQTHAASLIELKDGRIRAFWFAGSREGARDVDIRSSVFDPAQGLWGAEQTVATREGTQLSLHRYISKLGNPVAGRAADGTLWLYYVTVTLGGWAGSSITAMPSRDEGATWGEARRLGTSPFLNISTLVKGAPFFFSDGTAGLPVYHEFVAKFGEILRLDASGAVLDKQRLTAGGGGALQPVVLVKSPSEALVLMRYSGASFPRRAIAVATRDGGQHWSEPAKTALLNPDSALTALALPDGRILAALNNQESGRDALSLVISADGGNNWKTVYQLEDQSGARGQPLAEAAYLKAVAQLARNSGANGHGRAAIPVNETLHARFPHPPSTSSGQAKPSPEGAPKVGDPLSGKPDAESSQGERIPSPQSSPEGRGGEREKQLSKPESLREFFVNGHGREATPVNEAFHARLPHPNPPPEGEGANESLREFHVKDADADNYAESARRQMCRESGCNFEFSYPCLIRTGSGDFHLVYTWNRSFIKHVSFSQAWLEQRIQEAGSP